MDENKKIGYRPDLKYTDEYTSDIQYHRDNQDDSNNNQDDINNLIDDLLEQGQDLQNLVDKLPDFIGDIIKDPLKAHTKIDAPYTVTTTDTDNTGFFDAYPYVGSNIYFK